MPIGEGREAMKFQALCLSASVLALSWAGAAAAQPAAKPATAAVAAAEATDVEEVVITAERRATSAQRTAISATVLTGKELEDKGITSVDQLAFIAPSLTVNNFGQGIDFNIRGIGKAEHNTQTTTGVITYRDGVATFPGYLQGEPYYDIGHVEILRGPQGTFVGQNATGGAVLINSRNPIINGGNHGYIQGQVGGYNDYGAQGAVNLPAGDTLAARIGFNFESRDSFYTITGPYRGDDGVLLASGRVNVLWAPSDRLRVLWKTDYNYLDFSAYPADPVSATNDPFRITANYLERARDEFVRSVVQADYTFGNGITLRSISGYQDGMTRYVTDLDGTSAGNNTFRDKVTERIISQEFNLISPAGERASWIAGAYYQHDKYYFPLGEFIIDFPSGFFIYDLDGENPKETSALFGQFSYKLTDKLEVQAGARYSYNRTTNHENIRLAVPILGLTNRVFQDQTLEEDKLTGKLALNYTLNEHHFLYAFVATGFRPGGLNVPGVPLNGTSVVIPPPFFAEEVTSYEAGWKAGWLDGKIRTQLNGYYNLYDNFQVIIGNPTNPTTNTELNNPSTTKMYGLEAQVEAVLGKFSLDAGLGLLKSELGAFYAVDPRIPATGSCNVNTGPASASCINLTGREQTYAPELTFNLGAQYVFDVGGSGDTLTPRFNYGHVSDQWATLFQNVARGDKVESRNIWNAQLAWTHGSLIATLYGTNIGDQHYVGAINSGLRFVGPPRQWGVRVTKSF
jgi:iron complex outermembrane receptor protein